MNGEMAHFPLIVKFDHEGDLECVASVQNNSLIQPNVSETHYLRVVEPVDGAQLVVHSGQTEIFEGDPLVMLCDVIAGTRVSFRWLVDDQPVPQHPLNLTSQSDLLFINRTSTQDSGSYMCVATNQFNKTQYFTSNSTAVLITVKEHVSNPNISFTVIEDFQHYSVLVTCRSTRGTPPVTFSLYNKKAVISNQTVDDLYASFNVPLILEPHLGELQCRADNGNRIGYSQWMTLDVVAVHGPVMMHYDYDMGENFAVVGLRFYCSVAKGSHPRYQWFLNRTLLEGRGTFYWVVHQPPERSILHVSAETRTAGTYHCEVTDRFNNTTVLKSEKWYFNKEALNRLSVVVVAAVFGCFVFLVSLVSVCCCVGLVISEFRFYSFNRHRFFICSHPDHPCETWRHLL
ncbi:Fc receptor-like protein 3 [Polymixia lowei]